MQTVQILLWHHVLWRLIWVFIVYHCPFHRTIGIPGLKWNRWTSCKTYLSKTGNTFGKFYNFDYRRSHSFCQLLPGFRVSWLEVRRHALAELRLKQTRKHIKIVNWVYWTIFTSEIEPVTKAGVSDPLTSGHCHLLKVLLLPCFIGISEINANRVDPDQTPRSVASDLGLHCLSVSLLWETRHKWVKVLLL